MARRFRIYLFGFILGSIIVYASLVKDRGKQLLGWLPSPRVLAELSESKKLVTEHTKCQLKCLNLGESFVDEIFKNGDVDFSKSRPKENPRLYLVEVEKGDATYKFELSFQDSTTTIADVFLVEEPNKCSCD